MPPSGPLYGSTASQSGGGVAWTNINNAKLEDGVVATSGLIGPGGGGGIPQQLELSAFGFVIPSTAIIDGIKLEAKVQSFGTAVTDWEIKLQTTGAVITSTAAALGYGTNVWPSGALTWISWGGATSLWGRTWTPAEINSGSFLGSVSGRPSAGTGTVTVDAIRITVYWHTAPAEVPKRYIYKVFSNTLQYLGNLPVPESEYGHVHEVNTTGTQITVKVPSSIDTSILATDVLTDESGATLTDESSRTLTTEGVSPIFAPGNVLTGSLVKNGNRIQVWEYSYYYPNGKIIFSGQMQNAGGEIGGTDEITVICYSDGYDLDEYLIRGYPYTYTSDQVQSAQNGYQTILNGVGSYTYYGQSWTVGVGVTNLGAINLLLEGAADVTLSIYTSPSATTLLGSVTQSVVTAGPAVITMALPTSLGTTPSTSLFFTVSVGASQAINIYYQNTNVYAGGTMYQSVYGGGGGGAWNPQTSFDLYFQTFSATGSTTGTFTSLDPTGVTLKAVMDDYISRGGNIVYTSSSIDATGLSLTYTFNTNTTYEGLEKILSLSPSGFYYYVDLGTNTLYFKRASTTADITLTKGRHLETIKFNASIENVKNQVNFFGGQSAGVNLYTTYKDPTSLGLYGPRLSRKSDNRVTVTATANAIGNSTIAEFKDEQFMAIVTVLDRTMDTTLLKPGMVIGFNGFGTFIDKMLLRVSRIEYGPSEVTLILGALPLRLEPELDRVTRELIAEQTIANPAVPS